MTEQEKRPEWTIPERFFNNGVTDVAEHYGWRTFHLRDKDSIHIVRGRGFPDLVMFRKNSETGGVELLAAELKRDGDSNPSPEQKEWLEALYEHIPTFQWRPRDWSEIDEVLQNGARRGETTWEPRAEPLVSSIPPNFGPTISNIIEAIESKEMTTGDKAGLRRMDPSDPSSAAFWKLISRAGLPQGIEVAKWGLIIHGIALMAHGTERAHNPGMSVGRAIQGNQWPSLYSESRLSTLLAARDLGLDRLLARLFRMLANKGSSFNWREMAWFILNEGHNEEEAEKARMQVAREYYRAQRRYSATDTKDQ